MKAILRFTALFLPLLSAASLAGAQSVSSAPQPASSSHRNIIKLDVAGILLRNIGAVTLNEPLTLPLLMGFERHLGQRTSANLEVLLNGGNGDEPKTMGLAVQGRYYLLPMRRHSLTGLYLAPTLGYRRVTEPYHRSPVLARQHLAGGGALLGVQLPLGKPGRLVLDTSLGVMSWGRLDANEPSSYGSSYQSYYEIHGTVADGRISLGYRF